ncbi:MAG: A24 family peptidase [Pirellulaceae bacterium]|jgi:prepilin peptidase CpaA|nr:A24 family peptidase [Pirellulaceae bacterium]MDP7019654.1 A24 family peptidase [Pirellulaceae bacterium]
MDILHWISVVTIAAFTATAAVIDWRTRKLPNWLTVPVCICGLVFHTVTSGFVGAGFSLAGFATGFAILLILWLIGGGGGGDVKLMGALGAWLGPQMILIVFLVSTILAVFGSIIMMAFFSAEHGVTGMKRKYINRKDTSRLTDEEITKQRTKRRLLPYALPVAFGTWLVLAWQIVNQ